MKVDDFMYFALGFLDLRTAHDATCFWMLFNVPGAKSS